MFLLYEDLKKQVGCTCPQDISRPSGSSFRDDSFTVTFFSLRSARLMLGPKK